MGVGEGFARAVGRVCSMPAISKAEARRCFNVCAISSSFLECVEGFSETRSGCVPLKIRSRWKSTLMRAGPRRGGESGRDGPEGGWGGADGHGRRDRV